MVPIKCLQPGLPGTERSSGATVAMTPEVGSVLQIMAISFLIRPPADILKDFGGDYDYKSEEEAA